jgi:polyferredoxin
MTYEECLEFCTKRMCVMGYFPNEIEEAAKEMFKADALYQAREEENE